MSNPAFAQIVTMPSVTLPLAGTVSSYTPLLPGGTDGTGVVGVKSGFTTAAGGRRHPGATRASVGGHDIVVLAAVTSMQWTNVLDDGRSGRPGRRPGRPLPSGRGAGGVDRRAGARPWLSVPGGDGAGGRPRPRARCWRGRGSRSVRRWWCTHRSQGRALGPEHLSVTALFSLGQQQVAVADRVPRRASLPGRWPRRLF